MQKTKKGVMNMINQYRYKLEIQPDDVKKLIANKINVDEVIGSSLDNYRFYNTTLQWEDCMGKHKVHFDEVIILEEWVNASESKNVLYGIKYRGLKEAERQKMEWFEEMLQAQENQEMEF